MKLLIILALFLLFSVSHADVSVGDDANNLPITTSSSSDDADPKIHLPTEAGPATELTQSSPQNIEVQFDLTDLMNRRPVHHSGNQFILPFIRHRCRHQNHHLLPRYQLASILRRNAEIIAHRHVAMSAEGGEKIAQFEQSFIPLPHLHRLRFDHDHVVDRTADGRREKEGGDDGYVVKEEYLVDENDGEGEHRHHPHPHWIRREHDDEDEQNEVKREDVDEERHLRLRHRHHHDHDDDHEKEHVKKHEFMKNPIFNLDREEEVEEKEEYKVKENDEEEEHRRRHHHHDARREHDDEDEQKEVKREDIDEERHSRHHRHHLHHHDNDDEKEHEKKHELKRNDIVNKIRKFLLHF